MRGVDCILRRRILTRDRLIYIYIYVCIHVCMQTNTYVYVCVNMYVHSYIYVSKYTYITSIEEIKGDDCIGRKRFMTRDRLMHTHLYVYI